MSRFVVKLVVCFLCCLPARAWESNLVWGAEAAGVDGPFAGEPTLSSVLVAQSNVVGWNQFYRLGGEHSPVTPTECRLAWNADALLVAFRCREGDMNYPAMQHRTDWYSMLRYPSEQDAAYPDKVDVVILPAPGNSYFQFAATLDGRGFGAVRHRGFHNAQSDDDAPKTNSDKITDFTAEVTRGEDEWTAFFRIPWRVLGGKPKSYFGFIPLRTRWRDSEITSPVAGNFTDRPPLDSAIEVHLTTNLPAAVDRGCLARLPSGLWRWRRPALLTYPDDETVRAIWNMEQGLARSTDAANFPLRVYLTQRWTDLLELEGFNFRPASGSITPDDLSPSSIRGVVNAALRASHPARAWRLLDGYLAKLDAVSRRWFADNSPGDIRADQWIPIGRVEGVETRDDVATLHCRAGKNPIDLHLSYPASGGIRLWAGGQGWFKPAALRPLSLHDAGERFQISASGVTVSVSKTGFEIILSDAAGKDSVRLGTGSIAFRFDATGAIRAVDFRHDLQPDEVVYGFGEKYDRFNENGNVLTLWGMDDWIGNTAGLRNESYKPIPVFHSSKGYMVFLNSSYRLRADIGKTVRDQYRLTQVGPIFDSYFWLGPPSAALESYTTLTGKPLLPPKWAFEPWIGRTGRGWNAGPLRNAVAEEEEVVKRFASLDIPHSAIYAEGSSADSAALNEFMAGRGIHVLSWYFSEIGEKQQAQLLPQLALGQLPILNSGTKTNGPDDYVDFTNPQALELSRRWWKHRLDLGVAGSMVDFGDRTPETARFYDGRRGDEMHNFYSYDYQRTYHAVFAERRGDDFILFGRAAAPGTQRWAAQFAGDHRANFVGLRAVLTGALNLCACGFSTWGSDLGGFLGWPDPAVYTRWTQFACFSPLMRNHGRTPREPWEFGDAAVANYKFYAWTRENLLDYIFHAAETAHQTGLPIMRSLAVEYPGEPSLAAVSDEYLFGPDLLVAPVWNETNSRPIIFPPGRWVSLWDGIAAAGSAEVRAPLDSIPVYLRPGAQVLVNLSTNLQFGQTMTAARVTAIVINPSGKIVTVNNPKAAFLLVYGVENAAVRVDGSILPRLQRPGAAWSLPGWRAEEKPRRLIVHLPPRSARVEIDAVPD